MKKFPPILKFLVLVLCATVSIFPQQPNATLTGVVTDQNSAVITNAIVTATNKATNQSRTTTTNGEGVFVVSSLPVGEYDVDVTSNGFKKLKITSIILTVGQTLSVDARLEVEGSTFTEELIGEVPLIDSQTSKVDAVINDKEIQNLPLNGRNFLELALLTPGNSIAPNFDPTKTNTVVISSAGQIGRGGNVMIDGAIYFLI